MAAEKKTKQVEQNLVCVHISSREFCLLAFAALAFHPDYLVLAMRGS